MKSSREQQKGAPKAGNEERPRRPAQIAHVVIKSARYTDSVDWYSRLFQAEIAWSNPRITFLAYDEEHHRIAIINGEGSAAPKVGEVAGFDHIAFAYEELSDLLSVYVRLKNEGIEPVRSINHGMTTSLYYLDPDGNRVELQVDNFEKAEAAAYMDTDEFSANPTGTEFDPDDLVRRFDAGEPVAELLSPRPRGAVS